MSGRGEGKEKRSDHYSTLGFPGKIAEDLKGVIDYVEAALKIIVFSCFGYNVFLVHNAIHDSSALQKSGHVTANKFIYCEGYLFQIQN